MKLLVEAGVVGLVTLGAGSLLLGPNVSKTRLFLLGSGLHLGFEAVGLNRWYCREGVACLT